ncbi:phytoene/squalene synthase family protein [Fibrobacterota bacterium]
MTNGEIIQLEDYARFMLQKVSRTFAINIQVLPGRLQLQVLLAYLFCRMADTVEDDATLPPAEKIPLLNQFRSLFPCKIGWEQEVKEWAGRLPGSWKESSSWEQLLAYHSKWIFTLYHDLPEKPALSIANWVREMCKGMAEFTQRQVSGREQKFLIQTMNDLDRYCYYVAGTVGNMLCELFYHHSLLINQRSHGRLKRFSVSFGLGLQLINILKDVYQDLERNILYIPRSLMQDNNLSPESFSLPESRGRAENITRRLIEKARGHLSDAIEYTCRLPRLEPRLRLFCLWPLFMAVETLILICEKGSIFHPGEKIKISRDQVKKILRHTSLICLSNLFIRRTFKAKMVAIDSLMSRSA